MSQLGTRTFSAEDLEWFAAASGDWNPVHVDRVAARRLLVGKVVVHGVYLLFWALDCHFKNGGTAFKDLDVSFKKYVSLDEKIVVRRFDDEQDVVRLVVMRKDEEVLSVRLAGTAIPIENLVPHGNPERLKPKNKAFEELKSDSGQLDLRLEPDDFSRQFPSTVRLIGNQTVAAIMAISRIAGMECPGLHSLVVAISFLIDDKCGGNQLNWHVSRHNSAFAPVRVEFEGGGLRGSVDAFVRPDIVSQPSMQAVMTEVSRKEFNEQRALIIGGSRGLGELTGKIIAAGGGEVCLTYKSDPADGERVVNEIRDSGGIAHHLHADVMQPDALIQNLSSIYFKPTHTYYFASPHISGNACSEFDLDLFNRFSIVYVQAFENIAMALGQSFGEQYIFFPSTIFVTRPVKNFREYIAAKSAGESLCTYIDNFHKNLKILVRQLPRLSTDQSASMIPRSIEPALPVMLSVARDLNALRDCR